MKRLLFLVGSVALVLLAITCLQEVPAEMPNTKPPAIFHDGMVYRSTGRAMSAEIDPSAILGTVTSVVHGSTWPAEQGQINFPAEDAQYAKVYDGIVVQIDREWVLFQVQTEE